MIYRDRLNFRPLLKIKIGVFKNQFCSSENPYYHKHKTINNIYKTFLNKKIGQTLSIKNKNDLYFRTEETVDK